jgi:hypothetical protein
MYVMLISKAFVFGYCRLFLQKPANPDLLYIIFFCHTQLTVTLLLCLIFGSKVRGEVQKGLPKSCHFT